MDRFILEKLRADEPALERTQKKNAGKCRDGKGDKEMNPNRRIECEPNPKSEGEGGHRDDTHFEEGGPIGRVGQSKV